MSSGRSAYHTAATDEDTSSGVPNLHSVDVMPHIALDTLRTHDEDSSRTDKNIPELEKDLISFEVSGMPKSAGNVSYSAVEDSPVPVGTSTPTITETVVPRHQQRNRSEVHRSSEKTSHLLKFPKSRVPDTSKISECSDEMVTSPDFCIGGKITEHEKESFIPADPNPSLEHREQRLSRTQGTANREPDVLRPPSVASVSASSTTSRERLEWDSGADVGYYNQHHGKNPVSKELLSTLERMAIGNYTHGIQRMEPDGVSLKTEVIGVPPVHVTGKYVNVAELAAPVESSDNADLQKSVHTSDRTKKWLSLTDLNKENFPIQQRSRSNVCVDKAEGMASRPLSANTVFGSASTVINKGARPKSPQFRKRLGSPRHQKDRSSVIRPHSPVSRHSDTGRTFRSSSATGMSWDSNKKCSSDDGVKLYAGNTLDSHDACKGDSKACDGSHLADRVQSFEFLPGHLYRNAEKSTNETPRPLLPKGTSTPNKPPYKLDYQILTTFHEFLQIFRAERFVCDKKRRSQLLKQLELWLWFVRQPSETSTDQYLRTDMKRWIMRTLNETNEQNGTDIESTGSKKSNQSLFNSMFHSTSEHVKEATPYAIGDHQQRNNQIQPKKLGTSSSERGESSSYSDWRSDRTHSELVYEQQREHKQETREHHKVSSGKHNILIEEGQVGDIPHSRLHRHRQTECLDEYHLGKAGGKTSEQNAQSVIHRNSAASQLHSSVPVEVTEWLKAAQSEANVIKNWTHAAEKGAEHVHEVQVRRQQDIKKIRDLLANAPHVKRCSSDDSTKKTPQVVTSVETSAKESDDCTGEFMKKHGHTRFSSKPNKAVKVHHKVQTSETDTASHDQSGSKKGDEKTDRKRASSEYIKENICLLCQNQFQEIVTHYECAPAVNIQGKKPMLQPSLTEHTTWCHADNDSKAKGFSDFSQMFPSCSGSVCRSSHHSSSRGESHPLDNGCRHEKALEKSNSKKHASKRTSPFQENPRAYFLPYDTLVPVDIQEPTVIQNGSMSSQRHNARSSHKSTEHVSNCGNAIQADSSETKKRDISKLSLQEALRLFRPDYVSRCDCRQEYLHAQRNQRKQNYEVKRQWMREALAGNCCIRTAMREVHAVSSLLPRTRRIFTYKEMRAQTERKYKKLPEVLEKKEEKKTKESHKTNRLMLEIYKRKLQEKALQGKVSWTHNTRILP